MLKADLQILRAKSLKSEIEIIIANSQKVGKNMKILEKNLIKLLLIHKSLEKNQNLKAYSHQPC